MFKNMYDTDVTTFSPQGRLFQVEYAMEAVKQGSACVGVTSGTHVVLAALKRSPGELASYQQKVFRLDEHMGIAMSGLTSDGRSLCRYMRSECLNHRFVYGSPLQAERLVSDVADKHQRATWSYVRRPYGVGLLVAAYDRTGPHLFQTAPDGNFYEWRAMAIGSRSQSGKTYLEKNYESFPGLSRDELIKAAVKALHACTEPDKGLSLENTVIAVVGEGERFHMLEGEAIAPFLLGLDAEPRPAAAPEDAAAAAAEGGAAAGGAGAGAGAEAVMPVDGGDAAEAP